MCKILLSCGHRTNEKEVEKSGTCSIHCLKCQKTVCIAEKHDCFFDHRQTTNFYLSKISEDLSKISEKMECGGQAAAVT